MIWRDGLRGWLAFAACGRGEVEEGESVGVREEWNCRAFVLLCFFSIFAKTKSYSWKKGTRA